MFDVIVVGAGCVGALIARQLSAYRLNVLVLEKENDVGNATSMANSAIVHSGYDPVPGTLKAKFNVLGNKMYPELCQDLDVHFEQIGSLTVALYDEQLPMLKELSERSKQNGVEVKLLSKEEVLALEPNISPEVKGALLAPSAGIVNPFTLVVHAMENAVDQGVELHLNEEVKDIHEKNGGFEVLTSRGSYETKVVINCAGIYGDKIHSLVEPIDYNIKARKGQYFVLDHYAKGLVNHVIFPLPSEKGKGILVSPTTSGNYIVGPSSEWSEDKDAVSCDKPTLDNVKAQAQAMVPSIPFNQVIRIFAGNRPTPSTHDFVIGTSKKYPNFINASGIESPGLVSSPAIAEAIVNDYVSKVLTLVKKENWSGKVRPRVHLNELSIDERNALIKKDAHYGRIICNCEKVTYGEILDELSRSVPPHSVKALKKRTRAGFGKCQGGFCQPLVIQILAEHYGVKFSDINYDKLGSEICKYTTKGEEK